MNIVDIEKLKRFVRAMGVVYTEKTTLGNRPETLAVVARGRSVCSFNVDILTKFTQFSAGVSSLCPEDKTTNAFLSMLALVKFFRKDWSGSAGVLPYLREYGPLYRKIVRSFGSILDDSLGVIGDISPSFVQAVEIHAGD